MDLSFRGDEGWTELDDVDQAEAEGDLDLEILWDLVASGDFDQAADLLEAAGYDAIARPCQVAIVRVPDAEHLERERVFVRADHWT